MNIPKDQEDKLKAFEELVKKAQQCVVGAVYSKYDQSSINYDEARVAFLKASTEFLRVCVPADTDYNNQAIQ
jgi:hypothetical protein